MSRRCQFGELQSETTTLVTSKRALCTAAPVWSLDTWPLDWFSLDLFCHQSTKAQRTRTAARTMKLARELFFLLAGELGSGSDDSAAGEEGVGGAGWVVAAEATGGGGYYELECSG